MQKITIKTNKNNEVIDITETINSKLEKVSGLCHLFILHTTACLTTADLDPGTDQDMLDAFNEIIPNLNYRHPHDPSHVGDHIISSVIGPSVIVPYENSNLTLGTWQRVVLVEMDGPRSREIIMTEI